MTSLPPITFESYLENKLPLLTTYKLKELKQTAKTYHLRQYGTKQVIADRLNHHFNCIKHTITLQRIFRGHLVRCWIYATNIKSYKNAVNNTDGYTLEPISDIPIGRLIVIKERQNSHNYYYIFDILTIIPNIYKTVEKHGTPENIYTRKPLTTKTVSKCILCYYLTRVLFPEICFEIHQTDLFRHIKSPTHVITPINEFWIRIRQRQLKPIDQRISDIFNEMHYLGNYVSMYWFIDLTMNELVTFYEWMREIWTRVTTYTIELREQISPFCDPFDNFSFYERWGNCQTINDYRIICIKTMEYIILDGVDVEMRKLGTMYVLCALTLVSRNARQAMPWLHEAILI